MKLVVEGLDPIIIPSELAEPENEAFGADTPYVNKLISRLKLKSYREKLLPSKLACLQSIKARTAVLGGYESFFEPLAGVGLSARVFAPSGALWLNDRDEPCQAILRKNFSAKVTGEDIFSMEFAPYDMIFLDFNNFTLKRLDGPYGGVLRKGLCNASKFVILNDCSIFYFRYGAKSFSVYSSLLGEPIASMPEYFQALRRYMRKQFPAWHVVHVAYFRDSAFVLLSRQDAPIHVEAPSRLPRVEVLEPLFGGL